MPQAVDLSYSIGLPPEKAIAYFKEKGYAFSWNWYDVWQESHAKAFTVAKAMRADVLQDIREMVQKSIDDGITFQQFQKGLTPKLQAKGWWGRQLIGGPLPSPDRRGAGGEVEAVRSAESVQLGSPWRLKTIYRTNLQSSYMAGRYRTQAENKGARPYLQYVAVLDSRTRPSHAALDGQVFPFDDPFWDTHYPPLGYNCRCRTRALSEKNVKDRGIDVESSKGKLSQEDVLVSKRTGELREVTAFKTTDPTTGKTIRVAPDPGFNFNPGKVGWSPSLDKYDFDIASRYVRDSMAGPDFAQFFAGKTGGNFPVAVLPAQFQKAVKAQTQTVQLSSETLLKNQKNHPDLTLLDYAKLPAIIDSADVVIQEKDEILLFVKKEERYYFAVVKRTKNGNELYNTSFRITDIGNIRAKLKKGNVLKNNLEEK